MKEASERFLLGGKRNGERARPSERARPCRLAHRAGAESCVGRGYEALGRWSAEPQTGARGRQSAPSATTLRATLRQARLLRALLCRLGPLPRDVRRGARGGFRCHV